MMQKIKIFFTCFLIIAGSSTAKAASGPQVPWAPGIMGDYDREIRELTKRADGYYHVDTSTLISRIKGANMRTYMYLVCHSPKTDWADFCNEFMPAAQKAGIKIWVYLVPPSEDGPTYPYDKNSGYTVETGYLTWAQAIASMARQYSNLLGFVMDDFNGNLDYPFTPEYVKKMMQAAHNICPQLSFQVINYFSSCDEIFVSRYADCIDGVIFPYRDLDNTNALLSQIQRLKEILNGFDSLYYYTLSYPRAKSSASGDFARLSHVVNIQPASAYSISFRQDDDYNGKTCGYHFKRFLIDGNVVWSEDVAGTAAKQVNLDVTPQLLGKSTANIAFELYDYKGVSNFGVKYQIYNVSTKNFELAKNSDWQYSSNNANFSDSTVCVPGTKVKLPLTIMIYAARTSWHSKEPAVDYIKEALTVAYQAVLNGKADGIVTYCLNKTGSDYEAVKSLYSRW